MEVYFKIIARKSTIYIRSPSASVGLLRQQWFPRRSKSKVVEYHR
jgi:hypothetical protein